MKKTLFVFFILCVIGIILLFGIHDLRESHVFVQDVKVEKDIEEEKDVEVTPERAPDSVKILFVGDMMFDRWIRQISEKNSYAYIFSGVEDVLQDEDLVVGNLEGPITQNASISVASSIGSRENYIFTFPPEIAKDLYEQNIHLVNLGNNHIFNFSKAGLDETKNYLGGANVGFFGNTGQTSERFIIQDIKGIKIAFINYNQFIENGVQDVLDDLAKAKEYHPDVSIVYTHWGTEYQNVPNEKIRALAHNFVDHGADAVIGSHPHVVQTKEEYKGKMIYYSLGNFIFDQYFDVHTQKGLMVEVDIDPTTKKISAQEYVITLERNGQTTLNSDEKK